MDSKNNILEKHLLALIDPRITPEKALQLFSLPCFAHALYDNECDAPNVIFLSYIRFIMTRLPNACIEGIWEDILWKTIKYSRNLSANNTVQEEICSIGPDIIWINKALSVYTNCPNPCIRLELFRLIRLFKGGFIVSQEPLCNTLIKTICAIKPHHLYPSGNVDDMLFSITDMEYVISYCSEDLQQIISIDLIKQFKEKNELIDNSNETRFLSHYIQYIGVFSSMASSNHNHKIKGIELKQCCSVLKLGIGSLVNCRYQLPGMSLERQFQYVTSLPLFHCFVVDTIRDLTSAIFNYRQGFVKQTLVHLRDNIVNDLAFCQNTSRLPSILLLRQINGPRLVHQHMLLLGRLGQIYKDAINSNEENDPEEYIDADPWVEIERIMQVAMIIDENDSDDSSISNSSSHDSMPELVDD